MPRLRFKVRRSWLALAALQLAGAVPAAGEAGERFALPLNDHQRVGQRFSAAAPFNRVEVTVPSWSDNEGGFTLTLWDSPARRRSLAAQAFANATDNATVALGLAQPLPAGSYYFEATDRTGTTRVGCYALRQAPADDCVYRDGQPDRTARLLFGVRLIDSPFVDGGARRSWTARSRGETAWHQGVPRWIWYPEQPIPNQVTRYLRRVVDLPAPPAKAVVRVTGDDVYTLWLNDTEVGRGHQPHLDEREVTTALHAGRNVLAVAVVNAVAPAGLLCELILTDAQGRATSICSDRAWRAATAEVDGWRLPAFDDTAWPAAAEVGDAYSEPWYSSGNLSQSYTLPTALDPRRRLAGEAPARAEVRVERGGPRLFIDGRETYPLAAWSADLPEFAPDFAAAGVHIYEPMAGIADGWTTEHDPDWRGFDGLLTKLLATDHEARFLIRTTLALPRWWLDQHPTEQVGYALPPDPKDPHGSPVQASYASLLWRAEAERLLRLFLRHVAASPFRSRVIGYQLANGIYGEWHYFGSRYLPDTSEPMRRAVGAPAPTLERRTHTTAGLLRDPAQESDVIDWYRRFHQVCADTLVHFAHVTKQETGGRLLCGAFYTYLLENLWIQEAGHLAPERVLGSPDIDFVASPYTYQHDATDAAGHWLGRARGAGGDGGYRVLLESAKRHGKLYFAELDPSTNLETRPRSEGGPGSDTSAGSRLVVRRDAANMLAQGAAGWWFDLGPGWYADAPLIQEMRALADLGRRRGTWDLGSPAQVAAVYDARSFAATAHWRTPDSSGFDLFDEYFLNRQARALHRLGAPVDFLDRLDLRPADARRYKLFVMVNCFCLTDAEAASLRALFHDSGATVLWLYAPGYVGPRSLDLERLARLVGMSCEVLREPGDMLLQADQLRFGLPGWHGPRFAVTDPAAKVLGTWTDNGRTGFASRPQDGWTSIYVGTAPLPVEVLRPLAEQAGVAMWSDRPDVVYATHGCTAVVATAPGERQITLPEPRCLWPSAGPPQRVHRLNLALGDVAIFVPPSQP